jgi:hypothetical protein
LSTSEQNLEKYSKETRNFMVLYLIVMCDMMPFWSSEKETKFIYQRYQEIQTFYAFEFGSYRGFCILIE